MENEQWPADFNQQSAADMLNPNAEERTPDCSSHSQHFAIENRNLLLLKSDIKDDPEDCYGGLQNSIISEKGKETIHLILAQIKSLNQNEKYFLYLKLPSEVTNVADPFRQPLNPLGSRSEISRTIVWIQTHLEEDQNVSLPKKEVYFEYERFCEKNNIKPLSQADFGKVMKQVFPKVRARRLGQRGNSKYCYSGLSRRAKLNPPFLPDLSDRPLSTEAPLTQSSLTSAAWFIVKEWSQQQLGCQFATLLQLAQYLVRNCSIGVGTEAANKLTLLGDNSVKVEDSPGKSSISKHRETQLQLQKKLQQKSEGKERKRKNQTLSKAEPKPASKKSRSQSVPTPTVTSTCSSTAPSPLVAESSTTVSGGECSTSRSSSSGTNSASVSPTTQGKTIICDKPELTTQLPAIPEFNSFQKTKASEGGGHGATGSIKDGGGSSIVARLTMNSSGSSQVKKPQSALHQTPHLVPQDKALQMIRLVSVEQTRQPNQLPNDPMPAPSINPLTKHPPPPSSRNKLKYKPRLQQLCDNAMYNHSAAQHQSSSNVVTLPAVVATVDPRSQQVHCLDSSDKDNIKDKGEDLDVCDDDDFPLTRERLNSVSNIEKDAMDEYLGTNNSQHEEELSKYFNDTEKPANIIDNTSKLSTLRQLLEHNGISDKNKVVTGIQPTLEPILPIARNLYTTPPNPGHQSEFPGQIQNIPLHSLTSNVRRRVSFETPDDAVPSSPNTRSKNFNFTPISPGALSPNSVPSKCSSTSASPFVSPRNTPNLRNKMYSVPNKLINIKKEIDLTVDISPDGNYIGSNPASPMLPTNKSVLQNLLNSDKKVSYRPGYGMATNVQFNEVTSRSHSMGNIQEGLVGLSAVGDSTSLLTQLLKTSPPDFADEDLPDADKLNVKGLLNSLEEPEVCDNNNIGTFNIDLSSNNQALSEFGLHLSNPAAVDNTAKPTLYGVGAGLPGFSQLPLARSLTRSQSIDVNMTLDRCNPSRSVPGTPLSFAQTLKSATMTNADTTNKSFQNSSRSYPSTPLNATETFVYNVNNSDCLLNGQPIRSDSMEYVGNLDIIKDNNEVIDDEYREYLDSQDGLIIDESGILIQDDN